MNYLDSESKNFGNIDSKIEDKKEESEKQDEDEEQDVSSILFLFMYANIPSQKLSICMSV